MCSIPTTATTFLFVGSTSEEEIVQDGKEEMNLLQKCCYYELNDFVQELLKRNINANKRYGTESTPPILLAAFRGNQELIDMLVKSNVRAFFSIFKCK